MTRKTMAAIRGTVLGVALAVGALGFTGVAAQDATETPVDQVTDAAEDEGFDDWGLLGLLGLAGLAGLLKRPTHEVRTVDRVDRVDTTLR